MKKDVYVSDLWGKVSFNFFFFVGVVLVLVGLGFFGFGGWGVFLVVLLLAQVVRLVWFRDWRVGSWFKSFGVVLVLVGVFALVSAWFGGVGLLALFFGFVAWRFYKGRLVWLSSVRKIEAVLFGKPLDEFKKAEKPSIYKEEEKNE